VVFKEHLARAWHFGPDVGGSSSGSIKIGDKVEILGQHACMIAAAHPWYYIVDSSTAEDADRVVDVWVPCKGW
jgi:D-serine deaminase-like pyridoxal phosphate-dependent protein